MGNDIQHQRELEEERWIAHEAVHKQEQLARDKAESSVSARLDGMNELRQQINRERGTYPTREYVDAVFSSIDTRLKGLENSKSYLVGWVAAVGMATAFVIYALKR